MSPSGPTVPPPQPDSLNTALYRNIDAIKRHQDAQGRKGGLHQRMAERISAFVGSFTFVYIHLALFGFWIAANLGWLPSVQRWD